MENEDIFWKIQQNYQKNETAQQLPSKLKAQQFVNQLIDGLFPVRQVEFSNSLKINQLELMLLELLLPLEPLTLRSKQIVSDFFDKIPVIYGQLCDDAQAAFDSDPAAHSLEEVVLAYPGFYAVAVFRLAHQLHHLGVSVLPRLMSEHAHSRTGIDIHPAASVGNRFFIDHGTGIVIGETTRIGDDVKLYQGVTLGALSVTKDKAGKQRHPTLEDRVTIYSGSTILGGDTVIGHDSVIGGNVWLTESVAPFSIAYHKSEVRVRSNRDFSEPINFSI